MPWMLKREVKKGDIFEYESYDPHFDKIVRKRMRVVEIKRNVTRKGEKGAVIIYCREVR